MTTDFSVPEVAVKPYSVLTATRRRSAPKTSTPEVSPDCVAFAREQLGFDPDPKQTELLSANHNRVILNCCRQWGKSTVTAAKAVHVALSQPKSLIIVAAPVGRQSGEFIAKVHAFLAALGLKLRGDGVNRASILFPNGSRIVGIPGRDEGTIRGFSAVTLLIIDEASRVSDELYHAVRPMLAVRGGDLWLLSTPLNTTGFFYNEWTHSPNWHKIAVPATECPRIPKQFLEDERASSGDLLFRREYMCQFIDLGGSLFIRELIDRCFKSEVNPLFPTGTDTCQLTTDNRQLTTASSRFFLGVDLGQRCDFTAAAIVERHEHIPHYLAAQWTGPVTYYDLRHLERLPLDMPYPKAVEHIAGLTRRPELANRCTVAVDSTMLGVPVVDMFRNADLRGDLVPVTITGGVHASRSKHGWSVPKRELINNLVMMIENEELRIAGRVPERLRLVEELMSMQADKLAAQGRNHDDLVCAVALACWRAKFGSIGPQSTGRLI